jgi:N-acetylmuramoyl-L-alanine amidase
MRAVAAAPSGATGQRGPHPSAAAYPSGDDRLTFANPSPPIVRRFIPFDADRKAQMRAYSLLHYGIDSYKLVDPHLIIWHYTETPSFRATYAIFANDVPDVQYHELPQVCAHFVITQASTIYQVVPLDIMCRQVVGLNYTAIGIENVAYSDAEVLDNPKQFTAALALTHYLRCRFHIPVANVIGHNESLSSPYYRELVPAFRGQTHEDFKRADMQRVRARVAQEPCDG